MNYKQTKPCELCPFRRDAGRLPVHPATLRGMAAGEFACHKTADLVDAADGSGAHYEPTNDSNHCAGALIFLERIRRPHQMMRISERLGMFDPSKLDLADPSVYADWRDVDQVWSERGHTPGGHHDVKVLDDDSETTRNL